MTKKAKSVTEALEQHMNKQLLLHAAGTFITCPQCSNILDWSTVIILDVFREKKTVHVEKKIFCTGCVKEPSTIKFDDLEKENHIQIEVMSKNFSR